MHRGGRCPAVPALLMASMGTWLIGAEQAAWTMPEEQHAAVMAVIDHALACGVPDARGAQLCAGAVDYSHSTADGGSSGYSSGGSDQVHLRLSDGSMLLFCVIPLALKTPGAVLDIQKMKPLTSAGLLAMGMRFDRRYLLGRLDPAQRAMYAATADIEAILGKLGAIKWRLQGLIAAYLMRLGIPGADLAPICLAVDRLVQDDDERYWDAPQPMFLGPDSQVAIDRERWRWHRWEARKDPLVLADPALTLRRALFADAVQAATMASDPNPHHVLGLPLPLGTAIALGDAMLALDEAEAHRRWERIKAGLQVAPAGTDVASRLACWRGGPRDDTDRGEERDPSYQASDLDALVELCADERPSRWFESYQPRTVGDQALRAISDLLQLDIRRLIGRDLLAPWSDQERRETAAAVKTWWTAHRGEPIADLLAAAAPQLTLTQLADLLIRADAEHRHAVYDGLTRAWRAPPADAGNEAGKLDTILALGLADAPFAALVDAWTPQADSRLVMAVWHQVHGQAAPFDAWFADAVAQPAGQNAGSDGLRPDWGLPVIMGFPTVARIRRLRLAMRAEGVDEAAANIIMGINRHGGVPGTRLIEAARTDDPVMSKRIQAVLALLILACLDDHRPASQEMRDHAAAVLKLVIVERKLVDVAHGKPPPNDLRIADYAAASVARHHQDGDFAGSPLGAFPISELLFDYGAPLPEREAGAMRLRDRLMGVLPAMLEAARLPADLLQASAATARTDANF